MLSVRLSLCPPLLTIYPVVRLNEIQQEDRTIEDHLVITFLIP
jgi:hypothetical protein